MKKHLLALAMMALVEPAVALLIAVSTALAQPAGPVPTYCNKTAVGSSGAATTLAVTGVVGQNINLCGFIASAGAAVGTFQIITGTGAICGTGTVNVIGLVNLAINSSLPYSPSVAQYAMPTVPTPNSMCVVVTGTGPVSWTLFYGQY